MALSFTVQCQQWAEKLDINVSTVVRRCAAQLYSDIVTRWPVDTGYSRRNWQVSVDPPPTDVIGVRPKKVKGKATEVLPPLYEPSGANDQTLNMIPKGTMKIWLVNNVVYAEALENGWSKQAPMGCVRIAIAQLRKDMIMQGIK